MTFGRLVVVGVAIGLSSHATPIYLSESAPQEFRGRLVSLFNVFVVLGQVLAGLVDGAFFYVQGGWRWMLDLAACLSACLSVLQAFGFIFLPESSRHVVKSGNCQKAREILSS